MVLSVFIYVKMEQSCLWFEGNDLKYESTVPITFLRCMIFLLHA